MDGLRDEAKQVDEGVERQAWVSAELVELVGRALLLRVHGVGATWWDSVAF